MSNKKKSNNIPEIMVSLSTNKQNCFDILKNNLVINFILRHKTQKIS